MQDLQQRKIIDDSKRSDATNGQLVGVFSLIYIVQALNGSWEFWVKESCFERHSRPQKHLSNLRMNKVRVFL